MNPAAMTPFGLALLAYSKGRAGAELVLWRDDGLREALPAAHFFRGSSEFSAIETTALDRCCGRVIDVGAGAGIHSLALQARGLAVTSIDVCPEAVEVMVSRGVRDARVADVFDYSDDPFDTLLLMGHGIGMVQDVAGLDRFLAHARNLVRPGGQILLESVDAGRTSSPRHTSYHEANRRAGRYIGEIRMRIEFQETVGPMYGWLLVDSVTLAGRARLAGWDTEVLVEQETGEYLARLERAR